MSGGQQSLAAAQLLPLEAVFCGPTNFGTADGADGCFCDDGSGYIVKKIEPQNVSSPHNEWLCANLAAQANVPIAPYNIVKHTDGQLWFGSQYRVGEVKDWWLRVLDGSIPLTSISSDLSKIYAFDLFISNIDRHMKNYLVVPTSNGYSALAMDHGRAWRFTGFPPPEAPFSPQSNTTNAFNWMKAHFAGFVEKAPMFDVLNSLKNISADHIEDVFARQPSHWLGAADVVATIEWWRSGAPVERVDKLVDGIANDHLI